MIRYILNSTTGSRRSNVYYVYDKVTKREYSFGSRKAAERWIADQEAMDEAVRQVRREDPYAHNGNDRVEFAGWSKL